MKYSYKQLRQMALNFRSMMSIKDPKCDQILSEVSNRSGLSKEDVMRRIYDYIG